MTNFFPSERNQPYETLPDDSEGVPRQRIEDKNDRFCNKILSIIIIFTLVFLSINAYLQSNLIEDQNSKISYLDSQTNQFEKILKKINQLESFMNKLKKQQNLKSSRSLHQLAQQPKRDISVNKEAPQNKEQKEIKNNALVQRTEDERSDEQSLMIDYLQEIEKKKHYDNKVKYLESLIPLSSFLQYSQPKNAYHQYKNNIQLAHDTIMNKRELAKMQQAQYDWMANKYHFGKYPKELPFCIIVPTYNNAKEFRYEYNMQSIINQKYDNYHVVVIDDASDDGTAQLIQRFLNKYNVQQGLVQVFINSQKSTAVLNIHNAVTKHCKTGQIAFLVDGDDELLGNYIFKVFNTIYQEHKSDVVYSDHLQVYWHQDRVIKGWSSSYSDEQKQKNQYRDVPQRIAHLRSFKVDQYLKIKEADLKDKDGKWFTNNYDEAICLPLLEMSCGRNYYLEQYMYLYNFGIGSNDWLMDTSSQRSVAQFIRSRPKYTCSETSDKIK